MKLHHLLQKRSSFLIKLAVFLASGAARVKLRQNGTISWWLTRLLWQPAARLKSEPQNPPKADKYRMSNIEWRRKESLREIFFKTDRIHSFYVRCWTFDVRCSLVSLSIRLAAFLASGCAYMKLHHLLQKCSFFLIKLVVFLASGAAYMKLPQNGMFSWWLDWPLRWSGLNSEPQNIEYRTAEFQRVVSLCSFFFYKTDRIHSFDIRHSLFDIRYSPFESFFFD